MRIGTRGSALALAQARYIAERLEAQRRGPCEIVAIVTRGDRGQRAEERDAVAEDDKSQWVAELESALSGGEIDLAVHSAKDLPGELARGLALHGAPPRAGAEDALCGARTLEDLEPGAREAVGHPADLVVETPPLLDNDHAGAPLAGSRQIAFSPSPVGACELDHRTHWINLLRPGVQASAKAGITSRANSSTDCITSSCEIVPKAKSHTKYVAPAASTWVAM